MKRKYILNFNYLIADFVSRLMVGSLRKLRYIKIVKTDVALRLLRILYKHGVIRTFRIELNYISVYFKFRKGQPLGKLTLVSRPGKRCYWKLGNLSKKYNNNNFSGFYIISTSQGFVTSDYCLLSGHEGGEVLIKIEI